MEKKNIYVTQPSLAPLEEYVEILKQVWASGILTHHGPMVQKLEKELIKKIDVASFTLVTNGTVAIEMAIKALELKGEIITTPFTWIATISAIKYKECTPIFCDIDAETLNMDPSKIEALITKDTVAIMPVHVFGNPCDVEAIEAIAKKHNLKVIYDAAHAIGSTVAGASVLNSGDISTTSLHATKLFNTAEGGGCITVNPDYQAKLERIRFFGHDAKKDVVEDGINGKMTEVHAALGLANLPYYDEVLLDRKTKYFHYKEALSKKHDLSFQKEKFGKSNYSYFPVIFKSEAQLLTVTAELAASNYFARRYFYPSVNKYDKVVTYQECPISEDIASRILCLPLYWKLSKEDMNNMINIINQHVS